ncbi:MAG TPA: hypothetical protein VHA12_01825, partial [Candidatus Nanoarchaeia archaeon]|nr:hypothetical protein [Candidatus Nanoarchaeia archaeon]
LGLTSIIAPFVGEITVISSKVAERLFEDRIEEINSLNARREDKNKNINYLIANKENTVKSYRLGTDIFLAIAGLSLGSGLLYHSKKFSEEIEEMRRRANIE